MIRYNKILAQFSDLIKLTEKDYLVVALSKISELTELAEKY